MQPDKSSYLIEQILHQTQSVLFPLHHTVVLPKHDICLIPPLPFRDGIFFYLEQGNVQFQIEDAKFTLQAGDAILSHQTYSTAQNVWVIQQKIVPFMRLFSLSK